jgi:hypothetical protein
MNKRLRQPTGAAGSLFLIVHNVKQRDPTGPSFSRARSTAHSRAPINEVGGMRASALRARDASITRGGTALPR